MDIRRRRLLQAGLAISSLFALPACTVTKASHSKKKGWIYELTAEETTTELVNGFQTDVMGFNGRIPAPTLRCRQNEPVTIIFTNKLKEPTTLHWHGLRIPIEMDGVPFLSQPPILPGETFTYTFTPPDAGTFWYHPHVNSVVQLGKGLVGAIIVEEEHPVIFDEEHTLLLKHWHINKQGQWKKLIIPRYSARMGTPGEWGTVNGQHEPLYQLKENATTRLRIANVDNTLTYPIMVEGAEAWVIAIDGNPIKTPYKLTAHKISPGMRVDLVVHAPKQGERFYVRFLKGQSPFPLCEFESIASDIVERKPFPILPLNPIPALDLDNATEIDFVFEWEGAISPTKKNGEVNTTFWLMNKRAWEGMSKDTIPAPLATLEFGKTYLFNLRNVTQYHHPIHIHGHTFTVLEMNGKKLDEPFHTDTVLLGKNGNARAAFVADNRGRWMYHCHVIEHMKTGLMGYIEVV
ncbi:multicopper oxidase family protein [Vibrio sp. S9_S30]|uniref:multicopper oxidase family protein n=1 Tax=Vibrio sp. S9_S30 TaxID=2720226 RepID=UPI0016816E33|nr:multicopper oxidase family protein [Vibrio sp. S9_S30]MBD1557832.1 multicopper oxidase family protein [Vibrio sp. S9_S30]